MVSDGSTRTKGLGLISITSLSSVWGRRLSSASGAGSRPARSRLCTSVLLSFVALSLVALSAGSAAAQDGNDSPETADPIASGVPIESFLSADKDIDWYVFTVPVQGTVTISMTSLPEDYDMQVFRDGQFEENAFISENPGTEDELIEATFEADTWFIAVYAFELAVPGDSYILTATYPSGPGGTNELALSNGSGASGTQVTVDLMLDNQDAVKGIQTDVLFDQDVASFVGASASSRGLGMTVESETVSPGRVRVLLFFESNSSIAAGTGTVGTLTFSLIGSDGESTSISPNSTVLSDPNSAPLQVTEVPGTLTITGGTGNVLALGSTSGPNGQVVTVPLTLDNEDTIKGIQLDVSIVAPSAAEFVGVVAAEAAENLGMTAEGDPTSSGGRVLLFFENMSSLEPDFGEVATLSFRLTGAMNEQATITPTAIVLSDPSAGTVPGTGQSGVLTVTTGPAEVPGLQVAALKNPGRPRMVQIFVVVENGSAPTVTAGESSVTMTPVSGSIYQGVHFAGQSASSVDVTAMSTNDAGTGTETVTVSF